eukprot:2772878-Pyramimonas_sp.AAC.1
MRLAMGAGAHRTPYSARPSLRPEAEKNAFRETLGRQLAEQRFTSRDLNVVSTRIQEDLSAAVNAASPPAKRR